MSMRVLQTILTDQFRFLTFRRLIGDVGKCANAYLIWGFAITWLAGAGRYWDHASAAIWQRAGVGSLVYVIVLSAFIWLLGKPLSPSRWSYRNLLLFVTLTSAPALLYAIPVEKFLSIDAAATANAWFLAVVAAWRVALYAKFLRTTAALGVGQTIVMTLMPLALIVTALAALNLEKAVFDFMGGIRERTASDDAYAIVIVLSMIAYLATPVLLISYGVFVWKRRRGG